MVSRTAGASPTPGLDELAVGQRVATVFGLHSFVPGRELVLVLPPGPVARASGDMMRRQLQTLAGLAAGQSG